jgi:hypothetical protein
MCLRIRLADRVVKKYIYSNNIIGEVRLHWLWCTCVIWIFD